MGNCLSPTLCGRRKDNTTAEQTQARLQMERERAEGQALLREMVLSHHSNDAINWAAVIAKANELHAREQEYWRKQRHGKTRNKDGRSTNHKRGVVGAFSVNMLTYRRDHRDTRSNSSTEEDGSFRQSRNRYAASLGDDGTAHSNDGSTTTGGSFPGKAANNQQHHKSSHDDGMKPIDEECLSS